MIDLHSHTFLSDGVLVPSELVRRAQVMGHEAIALTDHVDASNLEYVVSKLVETASALKESLPIQVIPGVEITHVPPSQIGAMISEARRLGARLVLVHGETIVEPVAEGTNRAAIKGGVDILAHPGLITRHDARLAAERGVILELTSRRGHSITNGHVAQMAKKQKARMVLNTDSHAPSDLINDDMARRIVLGAGLSGNDYNKLKKCSEGLAQNVSI
ncbi:MAG: histidinol phosphate phosphatase domain-containing protein [Thermodesulfobacteriota bacterium]